jgi:hypothetical protein
MRKSIAVEQLLKSTDRTVGGLETMMDMAPDTALGAVAKAALESLDEAETQERYLKQELSALRLELARQEDSPLPSVGAMLYRAQQASKAEEELKEAANRYRMFENLLRKFEQGEKS